MPRKKDDSDKNQNIKKKRVVRKSNSLNSTPVQNVSSTKKIGLRLKKANSLTKAKSVIQLESQVFKLRKTKRAHPKNSKKILTEVQKAKRNEERSVKQFLPRPGFPVQIPDFKKESDATWIFILPRDPYVIFAHWEISKSKIKMMKSMKAQLVLRMYQIVDTNLNALILISEIELNVNELQRYLSVPSPGKKYFVEIGFKSKANGSFLLIACSNEIQTPLDWMKWNEGIPIRDQQFWENYFQGKISGISSWRTSNADFSGRAPYSSNRKSL